MNERIRELFEQETVPNFCPDTHPLGLTRNPKGEYNNYVLEDHWQTFQEAFELAAKECARLVEDFGNEHDNYSAAQAIENHFGVK